MKKYIILVLALFGIVISFNGVHAYHGFDDMPQIEFRPHITAGPGITGTYQIVSHSAQSGGYRRYIVDTAVMFPETSGSVVLFGEIYLGNTSQTSITNAFITTVSSTALSTIMSSNFTNLDSKDWLLYQPTTTLYFWISNGGNDIGAQMFIHELMGSAYVFNSGYAPSRDDAINSFYLAYGNYLTDGTIADLLEQSYNNGYNIGYDDGYNIGYDDGYDNGYDLGYLDGWADTDGGGVWNTLFNAVLSPFDVFTYEIAPNFYIGYLLGIPLILGMVGFLLNIGKKK